MKIKPIFIAVMFAALTLSAQTNTIIFPQLLSPTNSVLMTNAEFRVIAIPKIYFKNDDGYRSFYPDELNSNVLTAIGTSKEKIAAQQSAQIAAHEKYLASVAAAQAEREFQQRVALTNAIKAQAAYQEKLKNQQYDHPQVFNSLSARQSEGIGAP